MSRSFRTTLLTVIIGLFTLPLAAQEKLEAKQIENPEWRSITHIKFHPGKMKRAMAIVDDHFRKASATAGTPMPELEVRMATGEWDVMIVWRMEDGVEELNWETSPNSVKWQNALAAQEGGMDKAQALRDEYSALIMRSTRELARQR